MIPNDSTQSPSSIGVESQNTTSENVEDRQSDCANGPKSDTLPSIRLYFGAYSLLYITIGFLLALPGSIYRELKNDLNASNSTVSWIFSVSAFSMIFSSLFTGFIVDKFTETHRYLALVTLFTITSLSMVPVIRDVPIIFILFMLIGIGNSANDTCGAVWIFRAWPDRGGLVFLGLNMFVSVTMLCCPLVIELSISQSGSYKYPLWIIAVVASLYTVFILILPTPIHDQLRSLKREIRRSVSTESVHQRDDLPMDGPSDFAELSKRTSLRLEKDPKYKRLQYILIGILVVIMALHRAVESGMLLFITTYSVEYAEIEESFGRYLMSIYSGSVVCYRTCHVVITMVFGKEINTVRSLMIAFTVRLVVCGVVFVLFGDSKSGLVAAYAVCGFCGGGPTFPGLFAWGELIRPFTGFISCLFTVGMYVGEMTFIAVMGTLADKYGIGILSIAVTIPLAIALVLTVVNAALFKAYQRLQVDAIGKGSDTK